MAWKILCYDDSQENPKAVFVELPTSVINSIVSQIPSATTSTAGLAKKATTLTVATPTLTVPSLLTGAVSLTTVQTLQNRLEELVSKLQTAGILS